MCAQLQTIAYLCILLYIQNISGLFIDVGTNYSVLDHTNLSFLYEDVLSPGPNADGEFVSDINTSLFIVLDRDRDSFHQLNAIKFSFLQ